MTISYMTINRRANDLLIDTRSAAQGDQGVFPRLTFGQEKAKLWDMNQTVLTKIRIMVNLRLN